MATHSGETTMPFPFLPFLTKRKEQVYTISRIYILNKAVTLFVVKDYFTVKGYVLRQIIHMHYFAVHPGPEFI